MKVLINYRKACEEIAKVFVKKYYHDACDSWWIDDEPGTVFFVGDSFYNIDRMIEALELNATYKQLYEYQDAELEAGLQGKQVGISFVNYIKYGWMK